MSDSLYTSPNVPVLPDPRLTLAHTRMQAATVEQVREALAAHARGEDIGVYRFFITPFLGVKG